MSTMIYLTDPISVRTRRRCSEISIKNPNVGEKRLDYYQQDLTEDTNGNEVATKQAASLHFNISKIAADIITITDPVTGVTGPISGYAIALWLEQHYILKTMADLGMTPKA